MTTKDLLLDQLESTLGDLRDLGPSRPRQGWLRAIRTALGMTTVQLAKRLQASQSTVVAYEQREAAGTITLATLRRAAAALDCELVYALVPRRPLREVVEERAALVARRKLAPVAHSMKLEAQGVSDDAMARQVDELARKLITRRRGELWQ
jgi:predicted DNA-binding mobile mystery protein A